MALDPRKNPVVLDLWKIPVVRGFENNPVVLDPRKNSSGLTFWKNSGFRSRGKFQWSEVLKIRVVLDPGKIPVVLCFRKNSSDLRSTRVGENSSGPRF